MIDRIGLACTGCQGCVARCPRQCIDYRINERGLRMPSINYDSCVHCNLCETVCPVKNTPFRTAVPFSCAAQYHNKSYRSSSGGAFCYIASEILKSNGSVYGAAFNRETGIEHIRVDNLNDLEKLCGSKYVQSLLKPTIFKELESDLKKGRNVLVAGTPCQVQSAKLYIKRSYDNLIFIDLVCHGVPSSDLFMSYLEYCESIRHKRIKDFIFRDNRHGWDNIFKSTIRYTDGSEEYNSALSNLWNRIFFSELATRPGCNICKYANMNRVGDITLGDFWGFAGPSNFDERAGVSLVLCNTEKGGKIIDNGTMLTVNLDTNEQEHPNLYHPTKPNIKREEFMRFYFDKGFSKAVDRYFGFNRWLDFKIRVYNFIKKNER